MSPRDIELMERQRLREAKPRRELDDDETLEAVQTLMRINPRFNVAMNSLIEEYLILHGESVAIDLGIDFPPEDE
jgi:hypothetical protein